MSTINPQDKEIVTQAAGFADLAYADKSKPPVLPPGNWKPLALKNETQNTITIDALDNSQTGFQARAWVDTASKRIYLAIAGTNDLVKDPSNYSSIKLGTPSSQVADALNAGLKVRAEVESREGAYRDYTVITAGHSWGKTLAELTSYTFGWRGVGFDGPGAKVIAESQAYIQMTRERGIHPVGRADFIACKIQGTKDGYGSGFVGDIGQEIAGARACYIKTEQQSKLSTLHQLISKKIEAGLFSQSLSFAWGKFFSGLVQHNMQGLRSAVEQGNFSVGGDTHSPNTKVLPYDYQDGQGNRLCTLQDVQGNPRLNSNGQLLC